MKTMVWLARCFWPALKVVVRERPRADEPAQPIEIRPSHRRPDATKEKAA